MLSILIPVYNRDVAKLVRELHKQAEGLGIAFEILVSEDCSTDKDLVLANRKVESLSNCSFYFQPENKGRTANRDFLAQKAKYNWLLFLDADVFPKKMDFLADFNLFSTADVIFGGISYSEKPPGKKERLRWEYGRKREGISLEERKEKPYQSLISQCILIKKDVFQKANAELGKRYGLDILFAHNLEKTDAKIEHIDNPIVHLGLESNSSFLEKSKKATETLIRLSEEREIPEDYKPIQKAYRKLKKRKLVKVFVYIIRKTEPLIQANLKSKKPSLFLFDIYRLYFYASHKK